MKLTNLKILKIQDFWSGERLLGHNSSRIQEITASFLPV